MTFTTDNRKVAPPGWAVGDGALVEVTHAPDVMRKKPDGSFDDDAIAAEAIEVAVRATNRIVQLISFMGGGHGPLPSLTRFDLEEAKCEDRHDPVPRDVPLDALLQERRILVREPPLASPATTIQRRLKKPLSRHAESESLWHDSVDAFYNGRLREAVVVLRAAIEVAWAASVESAVDAYRACTFGPLPAELLDHYEERALDWKVGLPERLDKFSKVLFGFSFRSDWERVSVTAKWDRLTGFFQQRHDVAHGTGQPSNDQAWEALTLAREVLDKLASRTRAVIRACNKATKKKPTKRKAAKLATKKKATKKKATKKKATKKKSAKRKAAKKKQKAKRSR